MNITYKTGIIPSTASIIDVYNSSGINRPTDDSERITNMYSRAGLVISAWDGELLTGIARSLTDFCFCCYLADLAVKKEYQHLGIGRELVALTRKEIGEQSMLLLIAAPEAINYYPKLGMEKVEDAFIFKRKR